ncbi:MAG: NAD(+)/NADH kinase [Anaerolineae bacterium]
MMQVGILYYPRRSESLELSHRVADLLKGHGLTPWLGAVEDETGLRQVAPEIDLLITLGGDGMIVHAVRSVAIFGVAILGVNLGRLGFLAEVEPADVERAIHALVAGEYTIENRLMVRADLLRKDEVVLSTDVINDIFVGRGGISRAVRVSVEVDGHYVMTQTADGIIVATPTGSTGYCLSAGGPIVAPDVSCLTVTPVAPHLAVAHAIVVPSHRCVRLRLIKGQAAVFTADGQVDLPMEVDDQVCCQASQNVARFVRFGGDGYFYETVLRRLRWPDQGPTP